MMVFALQHYAALNCIYYHTLPCMCLHVQVQHFDEQQEAAARRAKHLHKLIGDQAQSGAGSLSGKAQA
eukprot:296746-Chlamydomonas_euryale.AAC.4